MTHNVLIGMRTYGKRRRINLKLIGFILIIVCLIVPFTNWSIYFILKKFKGSVYV